MSCAFPTLFPTGDADSRNTLNRKMSCPKVDMTPAATCRSVNHTLIHREANALELALSRSRSPHNAPHSPSYHEKTYYISHIGYWRTDTRCWHHHTITVQGIRNDDQSLSPVTSLVSLLFLLFLIP